MRGCGRLHCCWVLNIRFIQVIKEGAPDTFLRKLEDLRSDFTRCFGCCCSICLASTDQSS